MASRTTPIIAFVHSSSRMSGVEFSTLYLAEQLDRTRFRPLVICPGEGDLAAHCRASGIPVAFVRPPRLFSTSLRAGRRILPNPAAWAANACAALVATLQLARRLHREEVDLVCTKGMAAHFYGGLAAKAARLPCVWHVQDLVSERARGLYVRVLGHGARLLADRAIVDGGTIRAQLAPFVRSRRVSTIHNGIDTESFSPAVSGAAVRAAWGVADDEILVGNVARLTSWKGQDHLLRAFAAVAPRFPKARLVLVGAPVFESDAYERGLHRLAGQLGIAGRVTFAGYRWDLPQVLGAIDLFVHSSIEKDTSPLAVVAAMASGKAIVSTNVGGVAELFAHGEAVLVNPADATALADGMAQVLADPAHRAALGHNARRKAESQLNLSLFARRCEAVFAQATHR